MDTKNSSRSDRTRTFDKPKVYDNGAIRQLTTGEIEQLEPENEETRCITGAQVMRPRD